MAEKIGKNAAPFTPEEVVRATNARVLNRDASSSEVILTGIVTDNREASENSLFVALRGERFDGHNFVADAASKGIGGAVVEQAVEAQTPSGEPLLQFEVADTLKALGDLARFHRQRFEIPVVAITGSYGKTTTRALIHAVLDAVKKTLTSQGNFNNEIGLPMTLLGLDESYHAAVVEMGMRGPGQIAYLADIALPTVGVITNIGPQHIELLGSVEAIAAAKAELLEKLPADGLAIVPADSPFLAFLKEKAPCRVVTFGNHPDADYSVTDFQTLEDGTISFAIVSAVGRSHQIRLPLPGAHNAVNAAAAFAVGAELGMASETIASALATAQVPGARMRVVNVANNVTIIDDCYNAGPDSMWAALQTLLDFPGTGRRVAILGAMRELGDYSENEHRKIGDFAGQFVEVLVGVCGETRPLLNAAVQAAGDVDNDMLVSWCNNASEAAQRLSEWIEAGDVILVKGSRSVGLEAVVEALKA